MSCPVLFRKMYPDNQPISFILVLLLALSSSLCFLSCFASNPQNNPLVFNHGNNHPLSTSAFRFAGMLNVHHHSHSRHRRRRRRTSSSSSSSNYNSRAPPASSSSSRSRRRSTVKSVVNIVNVDKFGARADGRSDDTQAFGNAWKAACSSTGPTLFVVPKNKVYTLKPITFSGPCPANLILKIFGTIKASQNMNDYQNDRKHWIRFESLQNFRVRGGGTIDGNGHVWWQNSCKVNHKLPCQNAPTGVTFYECNNLIVSNLRFQNSQKMHVSFEKCLNVRVLHLLVTAPGNSPNTDGIHVTATQNIRISQSVIKTGDDCISIVSGSKNVQVTDVTCGPGHGISIGSLGAENSEAQVSDVLVNRATLSGTTNGVRIKTWQGGSGYAKNIQFQNIVMNNVSNPIIIDQNYCDQNEPCHQQGSAVQVSNVVYKNIKGTSWSKGMKQKNEEEAKDAPARASCVSVEFTKRGTVTPLCNA
ncbi:unnamed protein product [Linum grandiflorum]